MPQQTRAVRAAKAIRQAFCDPNGGLTDVGTLILSDIAKFVRYGEGPTRHDAAGRVDEAATMEAVGMHKVYKRFISLLLLDELQAARLAAMQWPQDHNDEDMT